MLGVVIFCEGIHKPIFSSTVIHTSYQCFFPTIFHPPSQFLSQFSLSQTRACNLEAVQKFACKVGLKQWNLDYESMLQMFGLPSFVSSSLTTMYNIVSGHISYPPSIFVQSNLPYHFYCTSTFNFFGLFTHINYMYYSAFVPSCNLLVSSAATFHPLTSVTCS